MKAVRTVIPFNETLYLQMRPVDRTVSHGGRETEGKKGNVSSQVKTQFTKLLLRFSSISWG
jgi:hypothetical protein